MKKHIVVFGATGNLGVYTATILNHHGFSVTAVGKRANDSGFFEANGIKYIPVDICNKSTFEQLPKQNIYGVVHLAGLYPAKMKGYKPELYIDSVITGSFNVLEYCRNSNAEIIVFGHSRADSEKYAGTDKLVPADIEKKFPLKSDHSIYAICKNAVVDIIEHYRAQYGLKGFVLRMPTIYAYSPNPFYYVNGKKQWMAYRWIINQVIQGKPIEVWGNPQRRKEIVYVKDFVQIVEKCLSSKADGGVYNVGSGVGVSLQEQIDGIVEVFSPADNKSELIYCPDKPDARQFIHDISKTVNELGYQQQYNYLESMRDFKIEMDNNYFRIILGESCDFQ